MCRRRGWCLLFGKTGKVAFLSLLVVAPPCRFDRKREKQENPKRRQTPGPFQPVSRSPLNRCRSLTIESRPTPNGCYPAGRFRVRPQRCGAPAFYRRAVTRNSTFCPLPFRDSRFPLPFFAPPLKLSTFVNPLSERLATEGNQQRGAEAVAERMRGEEGKGRVKRRWKCQKRPFLRRFVHSIAFLDLHEYKRR